MKKIVILIVILLGSFAIPFLTLSVKSDPQEHCEMQCVDIATVVNEGWPISFKVKAILYQGSDNYKLEDFNIFETGAYLLNVLIFFIFLNVVFIISNEIDKVSSKRKQ